MKSFLVTVVCKDNVFFCENTINIAFLGNGIFTEIFITCGELVLEYKGKNFSKEGAWK